MSLLKKKEKNNPINKWKYNLINSYNKLVKEVGRQPDYIINQPNGLVCFNNPTSWIVEHVLKDEYIHHCVPKNHIDYLYTTVKIFVPPEKIPDVQSISGSVILDLLKNTVSARCASTGANYATLRTVVDVLNGTFSRKQISNMYKTNLSNIWKEFENNKETVKKYVITHPVKELQYHPFAFPEGCDNDNKIESFDDSQQIYKVKYSPHQKNQKMKEVNYNRE